MLTGLILCVQSTGNCLNNLNTIISSNSIILAIISILMVIFSLAIAFLLSFWWQSGQARYEHIKYLIHEYRDKENKTQEYLKSIEKEAVNQMDIINDKLKFDKRFRNFFTVLFVISYIIIIAIILLGILPYIFKFVPILNNKSYFRIDFYDNISTILSVLTSILSLLFLNKLGTITFNKSSSVHLIAQFYYSQLKNEFNLTTQNETKQKSNNVFLIILEKITQKIIIMKFNSKQSMYLGVVSLIAFILAFSLGFAINTLTGIPLTGGILNGIIVGAMITIGIKGVDRFGSATIIWIVFASLAIPTTTFGFPGWYKPIVGLLSGIIWDFLTFVLFKKMNNFFKYIIPSGLGAVAITLGVFLAMGLFDIPGYDKLKSALVFLLPLYFIINCIGGWLGLFLFKKYLADKSFITSLNSKND